MKTYSIREIETGQGNFLETGMFSYEEAVAWLEKNGYSEYGDQVSGFFWENEKGDQVNIDYYNE